MRQCGSLSLMLVCCSCAGLLHLYIHTMEMSRHPEKALLAADQLRDLVPDSGHLLHMPTHIDILCGNYRDVVVGTCFCSDLVLGHLPTLPTRTLMPVQRRKIRCSGWVAE